MATFDFSGIWRSTFTFRSSVRGDKDFETNHYSVIHQKGPHLIIESLPNTDSYRLTRLTLDGRVAMGTWEQQFAEDSPYKGTRYWGAIELIIDEDGNAMHGKWVGFGRNMDVKTGPWRIERIGKKMPKDAKVTETIVKK